MARGIFSIAQTCPNCKGAGRILERPCKSCHGDGRRARGSKIPLRIPAGVDGGSRLRSSGNGEAGLRGGPAGDLYVMLHIKAHDMFQRDGDDLLCEVPVSFIQAALGAEIEVPTLTGNAKLKIPAGTQPGEYLRMRGLGVKGDHGGRGDQLVMVDITVPKKTTERQKELLRELGQIEEATGDQRSFFDKLKAMFD
jgi:molecular chaperone DnaJ